MSGGDGGVAKREGVRDRPCNVQPQPRYYTSAGRDG